MTPSPTGAHGRDSQHVRGASLPLHGLYTLTFVGVSWVITRRSAPQAMHVWSGVALAAMAAHGLQALTSIVAMAGTRSRLVVGLGLGLSAGVAVGTPTAGLVGLLLVTVALALLLPVTGACLFMLRLARRPVDPTWLLAGYLTLVAGSLMFVLANLAHPVGVTRPPLNGSSEHVLRQLATADQRDRRLGRFVVAPSRDRERLRLVSTLDEAGAIRTPQAHLDAALLLQHGTCARHFRRAWQHAVAARDAGISQADALARAAYDRWMLAENRPQRYGTQMATSASTICKGE